MLSPHFWGLAELLCARLCSKGFPSPRSPWPPCARLPGLAGGSFLPFPAGGRLSAPRMGPCGSLHPLPVPVHLDQDSKWKAFLWLSLTGLAALGTRQGLTWTCSYLSCLNFKNRT